MVMGKMRGKVLLCLLLAGITLAVYWPVGRMGFIVYDDHAYVVENPHVLAGITWENVRWAFTTGCTGNWHPVTWLSHMLDCTLFGLAAAGPHWMNLGIHVVNTLLLFMLVMELGGGLWRAALVAALFAWHPLHVESVAWISERKDVLSAFFFLLSLWAYTQYVRREEVEGRRMEDGEQRSEDGGRRSPLHLIRPIRPLIPISGARMYFGLSLGAFALGLMSKPMLVTLPFVLLLLDYWPLGRFEFTAERRVRARGLQGVECAPVGRVPSRGGPESLSTLPSSVAAPRRMDNSPVHRDSTTEGRQPSTNLRRLVIEKLPFFALSLAACALTLWAQTAGGAVVNLALLPWYWRFLNAPVLYTFYLEKMFWPVNLSILYEYQPITLPEYVCSAALPVLLTVLCLCRLRSNPPVLRSRATAEDGQPSTLPSSVTALRRAGNPPVLRSKATAEYGQPPVLRSFSGGGFFPTGWLWFLIMLVPVIGLVQVGSQSIANRYTYLPSIGLFLLVAWEMAALAAISPRWKTAMTVAAAALLAACLVDTKIQLDYWRSGISLFQRAVDTTQGSYGYFCLGVSYQEAGDLDRAAKNYRVCVRRLPQLPLGHFRLGRVLSIQEKYAEAQPELELAVQLNPGDTSFRQELQKNALLQSLRLHPDDPETLNNLAWLLATSREQVIRDGGKAVQFAERACQQTQYQQTIMVGTLAAAYAGAGRFNDAMAAAQKACALAASHGETNLLKANQELLKFYRAHQSVQQ